MNHHQLNEYNKCLLITYEDIIAKKVNTKEN